MYKLRMCQIFNVKCALNKNKYHIMYIKLYVLIYHAYAGKA